MIGLLKGFVTHKFDDHIILDVKGIGYEIYMQGSRILNMLQNGEINLFIYTHVREDCIELFGFTSFQEKQFFKILIGIRGIGPKLALTILNTIEVEDLVSIIKMGNSRTLTKIPGIGNQTAERIILELKNKPAIKSFTSSNTMPNSTQKEFKKNDSAPAKNTMNVNYFDDTVNALLSLGYKDNQALEAVRAISKNEIINLQHSIKLALKELAN